MTPRETVRKVLNGEQTDKVAVDIGGNNATSLHVTALDNLIKKLGLRERTIKVIEPMMMVGYMEPDVIEAIGGHITGLWAPETLLGYKNENWKEWQLPNGTDVLIGGDFNYTVNKDGGIFSYPGGNTSLEPSAKMPSKGCYFDPIARQSDLTNHDFNAREDYKDQYSIFSDSTLNYLEKESKRLYEETDLSIFGNWWGSGFGDWLHLPGQFLNETPGIRKYEDWMLAVIEHPDYVHDLFDMHLEIALKNVELYRQAVGDRIDIVAISGTDFGMQTGAFMSVDTFREFYKDKFKVVTDWIHKNTNWKVFLHSCGSVEALFDEFIDIGIDMINPIQYSARGMGVKEIKEKYGKRIILYGGGIDIQTTLQFGTPEEVSEETKKNVKVLSEGGGYICAPTHNIQGSTPIENIIAFYESINSK